MRAVKNGGSDPGASQRGIEPHLHVVFFFSWLICLMLCFHILRAFRAAPVPNSLAGGGSKPHFYTFRLTPLGQRVVP